MILRKADTTEAQAIWTILQQAIEQRKQDGSKQWQDGYPNLQTVMDDIAKGYAHVLVDETGIIAYAAIIFDIEPAYTAIQGKWLSNGDYMVVHRVATSNAAKRKGLGTLLFKKLEEICLEKKVPSIKVDTNFDNVPILKILERLDYTYCGEVFFRGSARKAFEKIIEI